jgi:hypothetical protein
MKLSIGKLARILTKVRNQKLPYIDPYDRGMDLGDLIVVVNGEELKFEIRNFSWKPDRYKLTIRAVNWIHCGGTCSISIDTENIKFMIYLK